MRIKWKKAEERRRRRDYAHGRVDPELHGGHVDGCRARARHDHGADQHRQVPASTLHSYCHLEAHLRSGRSALLCPLSIVRRKLYGMRTTPQAFSYYSSADYKVFRDSIPWNKT